MTTAAVAPLFDGPLDIVGDVHGELDALEMLLRHLGYDAKGHHPDGRRLVFVGDLCDRGPDSPGVVERVHTLVREGRAQCVLGNHELNVLRGAPKAGNGWFFVLDHDRDEGRFTESRQANDSQRAAFPAFFADLPLALERADLRVVHAAWHGPSLVAGARELAAEPLLAVYRAHAERSEAWTRESGLQAEAGAEYRRWMAHLENEGATVPLLPAIGRMDEHFQMSNPIRVLTSGVERLARSSFFASGRWRMVDRVAWWEDYREDTAVIFGHYWRWANPRSAGRYSRGEANLFAGTRANQWLGPLGNAFCVDFSVGVRYRERRAHWSGAFEGRLAAVRWPERTLTFDDGESMALSR